MKFEDMETPQAQLDWGYHNFRKSGRWMLCTATVIYGYRVNLMDDSFISIHLNFCGGDNHVQVKFLYAIVQTYLEKKPPQYNMYEWIARIPEPKIKPFFKDETWVDWFRGEVDFENLAMNHNITPMSLYESRLVNMRALCDRMEKTD